jgi:hypothetical protein
VGEGDAGPQHLRSASAGSALRRPGCGSP